MPRLLHISLCLLFSAIVLHPKLATLSAISITVFWLAFIIKRKCIFENKSLILITILFLIMYVVSWMMNFESREHSFEVEKRVAVLLLIPFLTKEFIDRSNVKLYAILFCVSVLVAQSDSLFNIFLWKFNNGDLNLSVGHDVGKVLFLHRPYLGFFVLISSVIVFLFVKNGVSKKWMVLIFFNVLFVGYIGARAALLLHILGGVFLLVSNARSIKSRQSILTGIVLIVLFAFGLVSQKQRFSDFGSNEPRFFIWEMASKVFNENKKVAIGFFDEVKLQQELDKQYGIHSKSKGRYHWVYEEQLHWNTHNQYLDVFLAYGALGLIIILILVFYLLRMAWVAKQKSVLFLVSAFVLFSMVENVFARQWGVFIFSCIIPIVSILSQYLKSSNVLSPNEK